LIARNIFNSQSPPLIHLSGIIILFLTFENNIEEDIENFEKPHIE
jgi:hypothetical protein